MTRKQWTLAEKLSILEEAKKGEVITVCRKHSLSTATYYYWKKLFETKGEAGLKGNYHSNKDKELKEAEEKIRVLSKLLAEKEVELEVQRELLKKKFGTSDSRKI